MREEFSEDLTGEHSTDFIRRFAAGEIEVVGRLHDLFNKEMIGSARRLFRRYHVDRAFYAELGMVDDALIALCQDARNGKLAGVGTPDDFLRVFLAGLRSAARHRRDRDDARRRGGTGGRRRGRNARPDSPEGGFPGPKSGFHREEIDLDKVESYSPEPSALAQATLDCETLAEHLGDPALRDVLRLVTVGHSIREIGAKLGMSRSSVGRALEDIRSTWERIDHGSTRPSREK